MAQRKHRRSAPTDRTLVITDPRAIRVLAHETRLAILDELSVAGQELTASEIAERVEVSPSALSYHLRVLERYGMVARAAPRTDARERPWVRVAEGITVNTGGSVAADAAQSLVIQQVLRTVQEQWDVWAVAAADDTDPAWRDAGVLRRSRVWLTVQELDTLTDALEAAVEPLRHRDPTGRPRGSREVELFVSLVPRPAR